MDIEKFKTLSEEEQKAFFAAAAEKDKQITDLTAERDSFKTENEALKELNTKANTELKATKELNFTLARKFDVDNRLSPEESIYNFVKGVNK